MTLPMFDVKNRSMRHMSAVVTLALAGGVSLPASADEGGVAFWFSGQYASLAAVPATPGASLVLSPYYYNGEADDSKSFPKGEAINAGLDASVPLMLAQLGYAFDTKILGGRPYLGMAWGVGKSRTSADVTVSPLGVELARSDTTSGGTDLYPFASLAWDKGNNNWMTYLTGDIPVGAYDSKRLANLGIGHAAVDAGAGYTYLDSTSGREFSAVAGVTYNWENSDTDYQNGIDSHIDWAASQFLSANWQVGIVGYVYYQLTGDSGSGAKLGSFKSRVASAGPEVGYLFKFNGQEAYVNVRGYYEFWADNRLEGYSAFATISLPLGKAGK